MTCCTALAFVALLRIPEATVAARGGWEGGHVTDIVMITLVPAGLTIIVYGLLAKFWRWESPRDKAAVVAATVSVDVAFILGFLVWRFGFQTTTLFGVIGCAFCVLASYYAALWEAMAAPKKQGPTEPSKKSTVIALGAAIVVVFSCIVMSMLGIGPR